MLTHASERLIALDTSIWSAVDLLAVILSRFVLVWLSLSTFLAGLYWIDFALGELSGGCQHSDR